MNIYKFVSAKELVELGDKNFKEFSPDFSLCFYLNPTKNQISDKNLVFLVTCEISENSIFNEIIEKKDHFFIDSENLPTFNQLFDRIKIIDVLTEKIDDADDNLKYFIMHQGNFLKERLEGFLKTNNRKIITYDAYFNDLEDETFAYDPDQISDSEEELEKIKNEIKESASILERKKEKTAHLETIQEAVDFLINEDLNSDELDYIKNESIVKKLDYSYSNHFGMGMYLRNLFFHCKTNQKLLDEIRSYSQYYNRTNRSELGEGIIDDLLWRKLSNCETTKENLKNIKKVEERIDLNIDGDSYYNLIKKIQLLSYNFTIAEIDRYFVLKDKSQSDENNFYEYYYQQKAILARLSPEEQKVFEDLKQDYLLFYNKVEKKLYD